MFVAHYNTETGEITQWGTGDSDTSHLDAHDIWRDVENDHPEVHPSTHKVDPKTHTLMEKTPEEKAAYIEPKIFDVAIAVRRELFATDQFMVLDRVMSDHVREDWKTYRQALRDLSKLNSAEAMIVAWPKRPDNTDPIIALRDNLSLAERLRGESRG